MFLHSGCVSPYSGYACYSIGEPLINMGLNSCSPVCTVIMCTHTIVGALTVVMYIVL